MNPSHQQLERIVAYLDGELSAEASAQVEQQLASDESFRQELQGAERAWKALDELPMAHVGDEFAHTTMDLVVTAARKDLEAKTIALPIQKRKNRTTNFLLATMCLLPGALVFRVLWNNPNRRLLADLPVIQNVDIYTQFRSVDFLRDLDRRLSHQVETSAAEREQLQTKIDEFQQTSATDSRETWLASILDDPQVSVALRAKNNRFHDLSPEQQARMRELHQTIETADDREQLLQTMFRYQQWLNALPPSKQFEYRELPAPERLQRLEHDMERLANEQKFELTNQQLKDLFAKVRPLFEQLVDKNATAFQEFHSHRSPREQRDFRSLPKPEKMRRAFQFATMRSPEQKRVIVDTIAEELPNGMRDSFERLPPREKARRVQAWFRQLHTSMNEGRRPGEISEQELADFFAEELDPAQKERLLALTRDKMKQQLIQMYYGKLPQHGRWEQEDWDRPRPPRPGPQADGPRRDGGGPRDRRDDHRDDYRKFGPDFRPPRGGPEFEDRPDGPPPRRPGREGPPRRPRRPEDSQRPEGPPPGE